MKSTESGVMLPQGTPLLAKTPRAAEIFDVSPRQLRNLRLTHKALNQLTMKIGRDVYYDVPAVYGWFSQYRGGEVETR